MNLSGLVLQLLNGWANASSLFLVAAGLSLIFGVTRIVNFAHGSLYMLGVYMAYSLVNTFGAGGMAYWSAVLLAAVLVALIGVVVEVLLLRRIYHAPELFQLLATFALVLVIKDAALWFWGAEDLIGPRAPGFSGAVEVLGKQFPTYSLVLIAIGPLVLGLLWLLLTKTRWGTLVRAATQDRDMVNALGVNQAWLFTSVFALGAFLAGLGGSVQLPNEPATLALDFQVIGEAFVIVVVGGMGSIPGAYLAALIIAEAKALCAAIGTVDIFGVSFAFSKLTLVAEFLIMAAVLVLRPHGLLGRPQAASRHAGALEAPLQALSRNGKRALAAVFFLLLMVPMAAKFAPYLPVIGVDILIAVLFATSLHFIMGPGGLHSFGHAAYFGLGAYGAALLLKGLHLPILAVLLLAPLLAVACALLFGWFCVRLSGIYFAMLTLAFAQIAWSVTYQWDSVTGGSNGVVGIWPPGWLADNGGYFYLTLLLCGAGVLLIRRILFSPFGYAMRAGRDSFLRSDAIGIDVKRVQWLAFVLAAAFAGLAGALFAFSKGSISPEALGIPRSVDGLVMVLLGGVQTLVGPWVGSVLFTWLQDMLARDFEYWRAVLGASILVLVLLFPAGIVGSVYQLLRRKEVQA